MGQYEDPYGVLIRRTAHEIVERVEQPDESKSKAYSELKRICDIQTAWHLATEAIVVNELQRLRFELGKLDKEMNGAIRRNGK